MKTFVNANKSYSADKGKQIILKITAFYHCNSVNILKAVDKKFGGKVIKITT